MNENKYTSFNKLIRSDSLQELLNKFKDGTIREFIDDWKWIFSYSGRYRGIIIFYTFLGIFSSSLSLGASYVSRMLINIIVGYQYQKLWFLVMTMVISTVFSLVFSSLMSRISTKISIYVNNDIQKDIFDKIIDAKWAELNKYQNGDLLHRFNSDVGTIAGNAISWIPSIIINIYTFILTFFVLFKLDKIMAAIAILSAPVLLIISRFILRKMREYRKRVLELNSRMMSFEVETFYNFDMIKSFGILHHYSVKLTDWQGKYKDYNLDYNKFEIKSNILLTLISTAVGMVAFFYCLYRLWTGQMLYGDMTFFLGQREALTGRFNSLVKTIPSMMNSSISAHRVRELVELEREVHDEQSYEEMKKISDDGISVIMRDASFAYRENSYVYKNSDFVANPGEIVAILGPSGEGKTTLLRMLLGLISPEEGEIVLKGSDGRDIPINSDLRRLFSYVPQGNTILSGTIAENLRMVREDATDDELIEALKTACAWEFVEKLPEGINTKLGDAGRNLSMGQGQRISIARALLRDCPIMMLDEATSALDIETEKQVLQNIIKNKPNKTCIVSTHRLSVLEQCQRIYQINDKKINEIDKSKIRISKEDIKEGI